MRSAGRSTRVDVQLLLRVLSFGIYVLFGTVYVPRDALPERVLSLRVQG